MQVADEIRLHCEDRRETREFRWKTEQHLRSRVESEKSCSLVNPL